MAAATREKSRVNTKRRASGNSHRLREVRVAEQELRERDEELVAARQQLENERERYRDLFQFAPDAYVVTDEHGVVREANYAAARLLNVPPRNLIGKPLAVFVVPAERKSFRQEINSLLAAKEPLEQQWVTRLQLRRSEPFTTAMTVSAATGEEGKRFLRWMLRDIRELQAAEEVLRRARDELEVRVQQRTIELEEAAQQKEQLLEQLREANEAKDEFLGLLSHELRTSITVIYGGVRALRRLGHTLAEDEAAGILRNVDEEAEQLYRMIEDLLNLARIELGEQVATEPVLLQRLIGEFARGFSHSMSQRELVIAVPEGLEPVSAARTYVEQVLRNLVSNAEKYSPPGTPIEIHATRNGGKEIVVSVLDRGPGVEAGEAEQVFERFYRSTRAPKNVRGMGMVLTVCRRLVEAQSGRIWLAPREGGGLEANFTLPVEDSERREGGEDQR